MSDIHSLAWPGVAGHRMSRGAEGPTSTLEMRRGAELAHCTDHSKASARLAVKTTTTTTTVSTKEGPETSLHVPSQPPTHSQHCCIAARFCHLPCLDMIRVCMVIDRRSFLCNQRIDLVLSLTGPDAPLRTADWKPGTMPRFSIRSRAREVARHKLAVQPLWIGLSSQQSFGCNADYHSKLRSLGSWTEAD